MGLDSYVLRVRMPDMLEDRIYTPQEIAKLSVSSFVKDNPVDDRVIQLLPYCREVQVMDQDTSSRRSAETTVS